jgi:4,5-dihydroxyphthalate decarboxylase
MHLIGVRRTLAERHPWLPVAVQKAFMAAKEACYQDLERIGSLYTTLPWPVDELEKTRALMGRDFWRYGAADNAAEIAAMTRYAHEQGLTGRQLRADELFAPSTLALAKL